MGAKTSRSATPHSSLFEVPALTDELSVVRVPPREAFYLLVLPNNFRQAAPQARELLQRLEKDFSERRAASRGIAVMPTDTHSVFAQVGSEQLRKDFAELFPSYAREALLLAKDSLRSPRTDFARYISQNTSEPPPATPFHLYRLGSGERVFVPQRPAEPCERFQRLA